MVRSNERLEEEWPTEPQEQSWNDFSRPHIQEGLKHAVRPSVTHCSICQEEIIPEEIIDSHFVSEPQLELIEDPKGYVSFLDYKDGYSKNFNHVRSLNSKSAGVQRFAHHDCDHSEFAAYEGGDYTSPQGAISLVRKILHSEKRKHAEFLLRQTGELRYSQTKILKAWESFIIETGIDYDTFIAERNRLEVKAKIEHFKLAERELPYAEFFNRAIELTTSDDLIWAAKEVESVGPIAAQGFIFTGFSEGSSSFPIYYSYLPLKSGKHIFFLAGQKALPQIFSWALKLPILAYLWSSSANPKNLFWNTTWNDPLIELLEGNHGHTGQKSVNWSDPSTPDSLMPETLDSKKRALLLARPLISDDLSEIYGISEDERELMRKELKPWKNKVDVEADR